jgi:hypothetical protein
MMQMGYAPKEWQGRPMIAILNTWSDIQPCHAHFKHRVEDIKRGILENGGFPIELPALSLAEIFVKPTTMLYRNLLAMDAEELIRSHPVDGVVLMGGCDKTTPALLLGATSAGVPAIYVPAGQGAGIGFGFVQVLDRAQGRDTQRGRLVRHRARTCTQLRYLYDHGNGEHDDRACGGPGNVPSWRFVDSGGRLESHPHVCGSGASHRRYGA